MNSLEALHKYIYNHKKVSNKSFSLLLSERCYSFILIDEKCKALRRTTLNRSYRAIYVRVQAPKTPSKPKLDMKLLEAVEKYKKENGELVGRNAALSGSVRALQAQLARAE